MNKTEAWAERSQAHPVKSKRDFDAGYEAGAFEQRLQFVTFISENEETIRAFAGDRTPELLMYMLTKMTPAVAS